MASMTVAEHLERVEKVWSIVQARLDPRLAHLAKHPEVAVFDRFGTDDLIAEMARSLVALIGDEEGESGDG